MSKQHIVKIARQLRRDSTPAEKLLWAYLRNRKIDGFKFLRQHPIEIGGSASNPQFFVADFYCREKRLVIELDGKYHEFQRNLDNERDSILKELGITTFRIKNEELKDVSSVIKKIRNILTHPPSPSLLRKEGVTEQREVGGELAVLILAAGSSSRLGQSKQLLKIGDETLLQRTTRMALEVSQNVFVVLGSDSKEHVKTINYFPVFIIENAQWETGMGSSLKSGLHHLSTVKPETESILVLVCDQPMLTSAHLQKLIDEANSSNKKIICSSYKNVWGVPALFKKEIFATLIAIEDDEGARKIIQQMKQEVMPIDFAGGEIDIDTPEDLKKFIS